MTPILSTVIKSDNGSTEAARIRAYLDDLIESSPALLPYRYALIDVMALKTDSRVEVFEDREAGKDGVRNCGCPILAAPRSRPTMAANGNGRAPATRKMRFGGTMMAGCSRKAPIQSAICSLGRI